MAVWIEGKRLSGASGLRGDEGEKWPVFVAFWGVGRREWAESGHFQVGRLSRHFARVSSCKLILRIRLRAVLTASEAPPVAFAAGGGFRDFRRKDFQEK